MRCALECRGHLSENRLTIRSDILGQAHALERASHTDIHQSHAHRLHTGICRNQCAGILKESAVGDKLSQRVLLRRAKHGEDPILYRQCKHIGKKIKIPADVILA